MWCPALAHRVQKARGHLGRCGCCRAVRNEPINWQTGGSYAHWRVLDAYAIGSAVRVDVAKKRFPEVRTEGGCLRMMDDFDYASTAAADRRDLPDADFVGILPLSAWLIQVITLLAVSCK
jgi:hypothetical protein